MGKDVKHNSGKTLTKLKHDETITIKKNNRAHALTQKKEAEERQINPRLWRSDWRK